jgi:hypothetical protein
MAEIILCKICGKRRAKRACPAVEGDICNICCGEQREVTLKCPLSCEYLQEAHRHEKPLPIPESGLAYPDVLITERFIAEHEGLVLACVTALVEAVFETAGAYDADVLAALDALIRTHQTLASGLVYETRSENNVAAAIQRSFSSYLNEYKKMREEQDALSPVRNSEILSTLVFLYRLGQHNQNGRPRGRMYLDLLNQMTPGTRAEERAPSIIL